MTITQKLQDFEGVGLQVDDKPNNTETPISDLRNESILRAENVIVYHVLEG